MADTVFNIRVGGDYGCFTRPEFKSERVSYPVMTPSAARGICEAIFWKPEFRWEIHEIRMLKPLRQTAFLRNEIADRQGRAPFFVEDRRQQRTSLVLVAVEYVIRAEIVRRAYVNEPVAKYVEQFRRRLERGQCHHCPWLGTREFSAWFELASGDEVPIPLTLTVGPMLFDIAYREDASRVELEFYRHGPNGRRLAQGYAEALFFDAEVEGGVLAVPTDLYRRLYELENGHA